jgi:hypothetical protein
MGARDLLRVLLQRSAAAIVTMAPQPAHLGFQPLQRCLLGADRQLLGRHIGLLQQVGVQVQVAPPGSLQALQPAAAAVWWRDCRQPR